jgi:hypothetical protein
MRRLIATLALLASVGCAAGFYSAALGNYDEFQPYARLRATSLDLELARDAYVAVIGITTPAPGYSERPVLFQPIYPQWDTDETHFRAGRHRIVSRRQTLRDPVNCRHDQKPTLSGCRRAPYLYPGAGSHVEIGRVYVADPSHYVVIASEEFVDPYTLADDLFELAFEREELGDALKARTAETAATDLERALLDRPGSPIWGALYVSGR